MSTLKFTNNPAGRVERFIREHKGEINETDASIFSSGMKPYTVAPFIVTHLKKLTELAKPLETDNEGYV